MTDPLLGTCESCLNRVLDADLVDGTCPVCREAAAADAGEPAAAAPLDDTDRRIEYAAALYGITYPPGPLRTAAVVGAMLSRGLDAAACSALAVEQMGAALEERGQTAARLARGAADPSAELLAARLENERLRRALQEIADALRTVYKGSDSGLPALALRRRALALLDAPPSDLAPLRDLMMAVDAFLVGGVAGSVGRNLVRAHRAARDAFPSLAGEG